MALRDRKENYNIAQDLASRIEASVWEAKGNDYIRINYNLKNRELLNYLMDENNYSLRLSLLNGERKPELLVAENGEVK